MTAVHDIPRTNPSTMALEEILALQRAAFLAEPMPSAAVRIDRLRRLRRMLTRHSQLITDAIAEDYGTRPETLSYLTDVNGSITDINTQIQGVEGWMRPHRPRHWTQLAGLSTEVRREPKGVVGVVGPWNFPVFLVMTPAAGAIAAGNRVMIRPSSVTVHTTRALAAIAREYFDVDELAVATEEHGPGEKFVDLPFDHLVFTGSPEVGRAVARAASAHLTPVTLELGGKNPVVVDAGANLRDAARRVAAARMVNAGQVCLCPDYVFVPEQDAAAFTEEVLATWRRMFPTVTENADYTSVVNQKNYDRINGLVADAIARGADVVQHVPASETLPDPAGRKIAPTLVRGVTLEMEIARTEIFGPVLCLHTYRDLDEVVAYINGHDRPLTLYWFGPDNARYRSLVGRTKSGSVNRGDFALVLAAHDAPFGGTGLSGYGHYHGRWGFDTLSHHRTVAASRAPISMAKLLTPPFDRPVRSFVARALARSTGLTSTTKDLT